MNSLQFLEENLKSANSVLIITHINPDGDALGSILSMKSAIQKQYGIKADAVYVGKYPDIYTFLPNKEQLITVENFNSDKVYDVAIALDVASKERMAQLEKTYDNAKYTVNIDHHKTNNNYGDFSMVNGDASSTGEVLFGLYESLKIDIDKNMAIALYTSILTDTGCFKFKNTTKKSLSIASKLMEKGVDPSYVAQEIYENKPKQMVLLNSYAVANAKFLNNNKIAYACVTYKDLEKFDAEMDHTEGIVEVLRQINTVQVAMLFKETKGEATKVSFRSKNIDVAAISRKFDGGGHTNAAGCTVNRPMNIAVEKILDEVRNVIC